MNDIIIVGAGNPDIIKLIDAINNIGRSYNILGFLEKNEEMHGKKVGAYEILGGDELIGKFKNNISVVINVSAGKIIKHKIIMNLLKLNTNIEFPNIIHPSIDTKTCIFGQGNVLYDSISLASQITIKDFNIIYPLTCIGHQSIIGSYNLIAANVMIGGRTNIGDNNVFSNSVSLNLGSNVCDDNLIGIGSVVIRDIKESGHYFGYPAKKMITPK